ncbi:MAG: hypothetical protein IAE77_02955 [Prosthecobacter sp.]|jgi:hypothetical protein|uniref:hypothetical protein n=1 Tax=Prosthecobacter sp. TaxID=1965333 RepID=UPI001A08A9D5|nr:hypothetical protein [Prosthecobacter sp.]MBE2282403.1 hypothetical protein [Prosthecobacter sp.]
MSFFDFLKPKKDPLKDPRFRPTVIKMMAAQLASKCGNLKAVGRETEARATALRFLEKSFQTCSEKQFIDSAEMLSAIASAAVMLGEASFGKKFLDAIIDLHEQTQATKDGKAVPIDLTQAYIASGRLAHAIRDFEEEYRCFWHACEAKAPPNCKAPATQTMKAIAHQFAYGCAGPPYSKAALEECERRMSWHDAKRREYAPECDWDDDMSVLDWIKEHAADI